MLQPTINVCEVPLVITGIPGKYIVLDDKRIIHEMDVSWLSAVGNTVCANTKGYSSSQKLLWISAHNRLHFDA